MLRDNPESIKALGLLGQAYMSTGSMELAVSSYAKAFAINPQVAARLANPFVHWRKLVAEQERLMKIQVETMLTSDDMSNDLNELLTTSLAE